MRNEKRGLRNRNLGCEIPWPGPAKKTHKLVSTFSGPSWAASFIFARFMTKSLFFCQMCGEIIFARFMTKSLIFDRFVTKYILTLLHFYRFQKGSNFIIFYFFLIFYNIHNRNYNYNFNLIINLTKINDFVINLAKINAFDINLAKNNDFVINLAKINDIVINNI